MPLLSATNLKYTIGTRVLLDGISFSIEAGERVGLVGRNGTGKTTLIKMLAGRLKPDSGSVSLAKGSRMGYLSQDPELDPAKTLQEEAASGFAEIERLHKELDQVFHDMAEPANSAPEKLERLMDRQSELQERIESMGGYATEHRVEAVLHGLGFVDSQFGVRVSGLSGGQKGRLALGKLLLESPELMLLDEPTNHLDIAGREWLEDYLRNEYRGAVIMISHDRQMLDNVVGRIEEIDGARLIDYPGNYTAFREIRQQRLLTQHRAYENQQSQWSKEEEFIRRFRAGQRAKEAQGRLSKLERQKELFAIERPSEIGAMKLRLPEAPRSADLVAVVREAKKVYPSPDGEGERVLFKDLTITINRGERWAIVGPNGAGKTTLVRAMLDELPLTAGSTRIGASVVTGYYAQLPPGADDELPVWEYLQKQIKKENPGLGFSEQQARDLAGAFLFAGREQDKQLKVMSGGERSRARLAALLASAKNLLVLDEPTNHLDIPSAERLEEALRQTEDGEGFGGTLILISHDRALIDATCDHLIVLDGQGEATIFHGNYREWHARQLAGGNQKASWAPAPTAKPQPPRVPAAAASSSPAQRRAAGEQKGAGSGSGGGGGSSLSWMSQEKLEKEVEKANARLKNADAELAKDEVYRDAERCRQALAARDEAAAECNRLEEEWLRRADGT